MGMIGIEKSVAHPLCPVENVSHAKERNKWRYHGRIGEFKVPLRVVGWCLWRSLQRRVRKCQHFKRQRDEARREVARQDVELARRQEQLGELQNRLRKLEAENRRLAAVPCRLPDDPPLESHKYGLRMICLAVNLARVVGLRPSERALKIFWGGLESSSPFPIGRQFALADASWRSPPGGAFGGGRRSGLDGRSFQPDRAGKGVGGVGRACFATAAAGRDPRTRGRCVLMVQPGTHWKRGNMAAVYDQLAKRSGRRVPCCGTARWNCERAWKA